MRKRRGQAARRGKHPHDDAHGRWRWLSALILAGTAMAALFAVAGYQVGNVAVARAVAPAGLDLSAGTSAKASLLVTTPFIAPADSFPAERPIRASLAAPKSDSLNETRILERGDRLYRLISPPIDLIEKSWRKGQEQRRRVTEHMCLARAIYFEARSESEIGRLAVAQVIMNRVRSPFYPDTICEVVYQNAERPNACQFSFACDGLSDRPRRGKSWEQAKSLATRAMAGEGEVKAIATATNYHADYVEPSWSASMTRLVKIGRHIFYSGG